MTNADITIYNYHGDQWYRTQIENVEWYGTQKVAVGEKGVSSASYYTVRVPLDKTSGFLLPENYAGVSETWTAKEGDIVVKGLLDLDITRKSELDDISQKFVVLGWSDNRRGSPIVQHVKVEGA